MLPERVRSCQTGHGEHLRFSALKTLPIPAAGVQPTAQVNVSAPGTALAGFQVSINGRFWVSTEAGAARDLLARYAEAGATRVIHGERYADAAAFLAMLDRLARVA